MLVSTFPDLSRPYSALKLVDTKERGISGPDVQALTMKRAQPDWASGLYLTGVQNLKDSFAVERFIVDAKALVWAIQNSVSYETIKQKLQSLNEREVADMLQAPPLGLSPLFAAVEARRLDVFRLLLHLGADSNEKIMPQRIPIMGFAILDAAKDENDMTDFVVALLARGANPQSIPRHMWTEYISTPCRGSRDLVQKGEDLDEAARWCRAQGYEELLAGQLHLTLRYFLNKAWELPRLGSRRLQVAKLHEITPLLETPYRIIGQEHAITMVIEKLISHVAGMKAMPLVMIYAGSSGHGKTELAKMMGKYLNAEHLLVDCTEMKHETDLLGPKAPYHGWQKGSPLSNHLSKTIGKRNIVFLDEFEKTTDEVRQALLLIWEDGMYAYSPRIRYILIHLGEFRDRRSHNKMKCTDTIWILATNSGEHAIKDFYETELESRSKTEQAKAPWEQLDRTLQNQFANSFGVSARSSKRRPGANSCTELCRGTHRLGCTVCAILGR